MTYDEALIILNDRHPKGKEKLQRLLDKYKGKEPCDWKCPSEDRSWGLRYECSCSAGFRNQLYKALSGY